MLNPLYIAVSWVLLEWHRLFSTFMNPKGGLSWALSIVMLVVTIRILLFRFFIKQVHSQRKTQEMQPKIQALREKHKGDRQTLSQEMMKLQREEGFNPLAGCLPILMQAPIFLSLFHVLRLIGTPKAIALSDEYHWRPDERVAAGGAKLFGAPIAAAFKTPSDTLRTLEGSLTSTRVVTFVLIVLMCAATFITQKQIMRSSGQVLEGQQAMIQKLLLYGMPASLFVSGFLFPLGVLLYWFTNNLWTMGQQFYILHRMPHPGAKKDAPKSATDPKALAPKPGQKPVNPRSRRPAAPATPPVPEVTPPPVPDPDPKPAGRRGRRSNAAGSVDGAAVTPDDSPKPGPRGRRPNAAGSVDGAGVPVEVEPKPAAGRGRRGAGAVPAGTDEPATVPDEAATPTGMRGWRDGSSTEDAADPQPGTLDGAAADGDSPEVPEAADEDSPSAGAPSAGSATPSGGPTNAPRPARRPPARRSSTTTRPKKKRR